MKAAAVLAATITEADFQQAVLDWARLNHWLSFHAFDSRRSTAGLPDLLLCKAATDVYPGQLIFAELKSQTGRVSAAQIRWLDALRSTGVEVALWRPSDWPVIVDRLRARVAPRAAVVA